MKLFRLSLLVLFLASLTVLPGCWNKSKKIKIGFVSNNTANFWSYAEAGAKAAAEEHDVELLFRYPAQPTAEKQKEAIDDLIAKGCKGIAVSVIDPENQADYLDEVAKKVNLVTVDNDATESGRVCYIGTDNYNAGRAVGKLVKETMSAGGTVALFVGMIEPINAQKRRDGVLDELSGEKNTYTKIKDGLTPIGKYTIYGQSSTGGPYTDKVDEEVAFDNATDVLNKNTGNLDKFGMVGLWAYNPPAILKAVQRNPEAKGKTKIVGFDEEFPTLQGIIAGEVYGTVMQQPYKFGSESIRVLAALAREKDAGIPQNKLMYIPFHVVKKDVAFEIKNDTNFDSAWPEKMEGVTASSKLAELKELRGE
ncbi:MAG: substrate-binding domain-containing protein [Gemmataceae bacterium]